MGENRTTFREPVANHRRPAVVAAVQRKAAVSQSTPQVLKRHLGNQRTQALIARSVEAREREPAAIQQREPATIAAPRSTVPSKATAPPVVRKHAAPVQTRTAALSLQPAVATPNVAPMRSPATTRLSISNPGDAHEREADNVADIVMRMAEPRAPETPRASTTLSGPVVQRKCTSCEEEHAHGKVQLASVSPIQRKETTAAAPQVTPDVSANIRSLKGGGSPLPAPTRAFFEPRFGADFSHVRVHTDTHAATTASSINAKAFTVGHDIAFGSGQYSPHSGEGQHLLAHELTHVVQQSGTSISKVQRDDEPDAEPPVDKPEFVPEKVVFDLLELLELTDSPAPEEGAEEEELSEDEKQHERDLSEARDWVGSGAGANRKILLLRAEDIRLQENPGYRDSVVGKFGPDENPDHRYLEWLLDTYEAVAKSEKATMSKLNENMPTLALDESNFIDKGFIQRSDGGNAFPDYSWNIIQPLISPSTGLRSSVASYRSQTQTALSTSWGHLIWDLSHDGIPASYSRSLGIDQYSTIKSRNISKLLKMPEREWIFEQFIMPEETELHSPEMQAYTGNVVSSVLAEFQHVVLEKWSSATGVKWPRYDAFAISSFRLTHHSGLGSIEEFYNYAQRGAGLGAGLVALQVDAKIQSGGLNPFLFLSGVSEEAQGIGPGLLKEQNAYQFQNFKNVLEAADKKIAGLDPAFRLAIAVEWSIKKGFAGEGISVLLENLDKILFEILKEYAKDKAVKKAIMVGVGWLGPWGRAISILYNIWDFFDDARDKIELALLIKSFLDILDKAKDSQKVVTTQQASAQLAQAYATTFQLLIQKLGSKVLSKVSAKTAKALKAKWKKGDKMSDAERAEVVHQSRQVDDARKLEPQFLHAEVETALKTKFTKSNDADYDAEVSIGNSHTWRRLKGTNIWCRTSDKCIAPTLDPEMTKELNNKANNEVPPTGTASTEKHQGAFAPGKIPRSPEEITDFLTKAGLEPGEIVGFGKADASKLTKSDAARVAMLGEHFTPADLKALGSYLFNNNKVLTDARAKKLIQHVRPGGMEDFLSITKNPEIGTEQGEQIIDIDPNAGIRTVDPRTRPKSKSPQSPADTPLWRIAEQHALPALQAKFGDDGWEISPRVVNPKAEKGEKLGSTVPEYRKGNQVFEVKRFHLDELGISEDGKIIGQPSKSSVDALVRARGQLATRESLIPGATQNIIFNITGQGSAANAQAIGKQIKAILQTHNIKYGNVYLQVQNALIDIE